MKKLFTKSAILFVGLCLTVLYAQARPITDHAKSIFKSVTGLSIANEKTNDETVGALQGKLNVSPTGSASYTIPIDVPPGTAGMVPKLSITYNSQAKNGLLGMGVSIQGLTAITRAPSNLAQNGKIHGVDFTDKDLFSLNGQQLVAVKGSKYGQDQTEYRTFIDSQAKVISYGRSGNGPANFKVWTKGGQVAEYGVDKDSSLKAHVVNPAGTVLDDQTVKTWGLNKIQDTVGNYLSIKYLKTDLTGELYPDEIRFTANDVSKLEPYGKIKFIYEDRNDVRELYQAGSLTKTQKRLSEILVSTKVDGKYQLVCQYKIQYEYSPNTGRSRVINIQKCNGNGICFKPTTFKWQTNNEGWEAAPNYFNKVDFVDHNGHDSGARLIDFSGNGLAEWIIYREGKKDDAASWFNNGEKWVKTSIFKVPEPIVRRDRNDNGSRFVDLTGNGLPDLVRNHRHNPTSDSRSITWLNNGGINKSIWQLNNYYMLPKDGAWTVDNNYKDEGTRFVDLTGNALPDVVHYHKGGHIGTYLNNKNDCHTESCYWLKTSGYQLPHDAPMVMSHDGEYYDSGTRLVDLTGNGLPDLVTSMVSSDGSYDRRQSWINTGDTSCQGASCSWQVADNYLLPEGAGITYTHHYTNTKPYGTQFVDLNGDGLSDLVHSRGNDRRVSWVNTGNGWKELDAYKLDATIVNSDLKNAGTQFIDLNGDGLQDLVKHAPNFNGAWINSFGVGSSTFWKSNSNYSMPSAAYLVDSDHKDYGTRFVDLNGSGLPDIVAGRGGTVHAAWLNKAKKFPDMLIGVEDGFGEKLEIDYEPLSGTHVKVYDQERKSGGAEDGDLDSEYPNPQFAGPMYVVYQTASDNAVNDPETKLKHQNDRHNLKSSPQSPYSTVSQDSEGSKHITTYNYSGARINKLGYGFLGFHYVTALDETTGITTTTKYSQNPDQHNQTQPLSVVTKSKDGVNLSSTSNSWDLKTFGSGGLNNTYYLPYIKQAVKKNNDLHTGDLLSTVTTATSIDGYGNPLEVKVTTQDSTGSYVTDTKNTYKNNTDKWFLGEVADTKVTRSAPGVTSITRESHFDYDSDTGLLMSTVLEPNNSEFTIATTTKRDKFGNVTETTVSGNNFATRTSKVEYDKQGRFVVKKKDPLGQTTLQATIDPIFGKPLQTRDINNLLTTYVYDGWGRLISTTAPDNTVTKASYGWVNNNKLLVAGMNEMPVQAVYAVYSQATNSPTNADYFDKLSRSVAKSTQGVDGTLIWNDTFYDDVGRVIQQCQDHFDGDKIYSSRFEYDPLGRMTKTINPDETTIEIKYEGTSTTTINQLKQKSTKITNAVGSLLKSIDNLGNEISYKYDSYGNMTDMISGDNNATSIQYDKMGRKISIKDPDKGTWTYNYDALGNLKSQTDAMKQTTSINYDLLGRMISRTEAGSTSTWTYGTDISKHNIGKLIHVRGVSGKNNAKPDDLQVLKGKQNGLSPYERAIVYDGIGRPSSTTVRVNGSDYTTGVTYNKDDGRPDVTTYSNGTAVKNNYNLLGFLTDITDAKVGKTYWHLNSMDSHGHVTSFTRSNGLVTKHTYNPANGFLTDIETNPSIALEVQQKMLPELTHYTTHHHKAEPNPIKREPLKANAPNAINTTSSAVGASSSSVVSSSNVGSSSVVDSSSIFSNAVQLEHYEYDHLGNMLQRNDMATGESSSAEYDDLNRVTSWSQSSPGSNESITRAYEYSPFGNITYKSNIGHYNYGENAGPHAVTSITDDAKKVVGSFKYDPNGNQTNATLNGKSRTISYTSYGKPLAIQSKSAKVNFYYNADHNRFIRIDEQGPQYDTTIYLGNEQIVLHNNARQMSTEIKISVGSALIVIDPGTGKENTYELLTDNLGSLRAVTDELGNLVERYNYTPFGEQLQTQGKKSNQLITHEGFTGHESIESMNLVHMNGRIYDPFLGRFLSADPEIQDPTHAQSLNRYSYCVNNPLALTDPTGYSWIGDLWHDVSRAIGNALKDQYVQMAIGTAISIITYNPGIFASFSTFNWLGAAVASSAYSGLTTVINGGDVADVFKNAAVTFANAVVWHEVGDFLGETREAALAGKAEAGLPEKVAVHALVGGGLQFAEGGRFQDGFLSAAVAEALPIDHIGKDPTNPLVMMERSLASGIVGGTVAAATGGNFANGAATAAMAELFNDSFHAALKKASEFAAGGVDAVSLGLSEKVAERTGIDTNSTAYKLGVGFGIAASFFWGEGEVAVGVKVLREGLKIGELTASQAKNLLRFEAKLPRAAEPTIVRELPSGGKAFQANVPGRVPGSSAVYEKQVDMFGETINYTKTTYVRGSPIQVKIKFQR